MDREKIRSGLIIVIFLWLFLILFKMFMECNLVVDNDHLRDSASYIGLAGVATKGIISYEWINNHRNFILMFKTKPYINDQYINVRNKSIYYSAKYL